MLPSRPVDWLTKAPVIDKTRYPTTHGMAEGEVYRPPSPGPHPGIVVCLGVVPFEVDHPQVPVLGRALARAGFAALLYWSPAMRAFRLDPEDIENIALAYRWFIDQPYVDPGRSGLLGTCVGGSFALMAAASSHIRDDIAFVSAYAPFSSMWTFARDIASATRSNRDEREQWSVDQLTRKVFVHSLAALLEPDETAWFINNFSGAEKYPDPIELSDVGRTVYSLLTTPNAEEAEALLRDFPPHLQNRLATMSPVNHLKNIKTPHIILLHDRGDQVIPIGESRRLIAAFGEQPGISFTEMQFSHLDPTKGRLPLYRLLIEFTKFFLAVYPLFRYTE